MAVTRSSTLRTEARQEACALLPASGAKEPRRDRLVCYPYLVRQVRRATYNAFACDDRLSNLIEEISAKRLGLAAMAVA
jgi:hypothetical protein